MARKKQESDELSIEQIESQLAQIEADRKKLETALKQRRTVELSDFAKEIGEKITERGFHVDEVVALLSKRKKPASKRARSAEYARYVDPDNPAHSYSRGPLPGWLREKMEAAGYNPADKAQREEFKSSHLQRVG